MKNGVLGPDEGFTIKVGDTPRTFRDVERHALDAAALLARKNRDSEVTVVSNADGTVRRVRDDGRVS